MKSKQFNKIVGPKAKIIRKKKLKVAAGSFKSLASLLLEWYDRKLDEIEANDCKGGDNNG